MRGEGWVNMVKDNKKDNGSLELALEVSDRVELSDIHLIRCVSDLLSFPTETDNECEVTGHADANVDQDNNTIFVVVHFNLHTANNNGEELAKISADFLLIYKAKSLDGLSKSNYDAFASYNGVFNAWPYWREFVNNMTARLKLPPLTLQVYCYGSELTTESSLLARIQEKSPTKKVTSEKKTVQKTKKKASPKNTKNSN